MYKVFIGELLRLAPGVHSPDAASRTNERIKATLTTRAVNDVR
jgi:hypothetical protein